ncbi:Ig-like domain-containing protein [Microbacterium karelineae]|uniref:Ig-like domain-containing protein n=1 Tax=Microbacterium karelineae TaxID=2654283 RepID=UPI0012E9C67D|nr:Ig-like domain-containing protein [Microbacterium karelineae]
MNAVSWLRARSSTLAGVAIVVAGAVTLTGFAIAYEGNPTAEVELDSGSVWVTKTSSEVMGHLNTSSALLDGQLRGVTTDRVEVMQERDEVLVFDSGDSTLSRIDGASMVLGDRVQVPAGSLVQRGGSTVALLTPDDGALYVLPIAEVGAFTVDDVEPVAALGADAALTVARDGTVHAFSAATRTLTTIETGSDGAVAGEPAQQTLENVAGGDVQITTVGRTPVVLDATEGMVVSPDGLATSIGGAESARIAADVVDGTSVRVATESGVVTVPLDGAETTRAPSGGEAGKPLEPVVVDDCVYAAWQAVDRFLRDCGGTESDLAQAIDDVPSDDGLVFRTNGDDVVLNDASAGTSWLASEEMQRVDNWDDLTPPEGDGQDSDEVEQTDEAEIQPPDRTEENRSPTAEDDRYGVRPGRSAVLPVLDNDSDPDGDVLTITIDEQPGIGMVQTIQDGQALQITLPENAAEGATESFRYTVDDGRGASDSATVEITARGADENAAPEQKKLRPTVAVETGGSVTYNVLPDWIDPDGDDVFLANVVAAEGDEVDFTADGQITYRALAAYEGPLDIDVTVSDGETSATGELSLDVQPVGTVRPITNADHVTLYRGDTATVEPLVNDINAASEQLTLSQLSEEPGLTTTIDAQGGTFSVTGETTDTFYVDYTASAGAQSAAGLVRVDVLDPEDGRDDPPVAVRDTAYLPGGGEALIDVLQNDHDPAGGVLVVQSVETPSGSGVSAAVLGQSTVRLTDRAMLAEQVVVTYRIHNGAHAATGEIVVIPVPATDKVRPPIAADDTARVRAGDIVTIPVTENDSHPNGDAFTVVPEFVERPDPEVGDIFVSQDEVRFRAASDADGQVSVVYSIVDSVGQKDSASVTIDIVPWNEDGNSAPIPEAVTGRAISGAQTRIDIPLERIDPDGDSVDLVGISSAPSKGRVTETGADFLTYAADRGASGVDSFQYRVVDTFGEESIGTIRVGIAPPPGVNQAPTAMSDEVVMRPGRTVSIPVLANDSDPEGDQIGLVPDSIEPLGDDDISAETTNDRVLLTAPRTEGTSQFQYTIEDEKGNSARGVVHVTVADDVPLEVPIARDDRVLIDDVTGEFTADIDLLANDEDPDGTIDDLALDIEGVELLAGEGPGVVRVAVEDRRRAILYTVTDADGGTASAFLVVPAKDDLRPVLLEGAQIVIQSDTVVEIPLAEYVQVAEGREARITSAEAVSTKHGNGDALVVDPQTLQYRSVYRYEGTDDITFEVTDGDGPDDPNGRTSVLTIPITVTEPRNEAPEFTDTATTVGAGDGPVTLDLAQRTFDIDEDELSYSLADPGSLPDGVDAELDGTSLTVEATPEARGRDAAVGVLVDDGEADPVTGLVHVTVAASGRPLPAANDDVLGEVHQGEELAVPVLENDSNPFEGEGELRIVDAEVEKGDASIEFTDAGVTLTPGADWHGYVTAQYTIADITDDPDRYVQARITATVLGVAEKPGTPAASKIGNRAATLTWTAPSDNGAEITEYLVEDYLGGGYEKTCKATVCTLDDLVNNREYQFQVTAINEVGPSPSSEISQVVRPDVKPEAPNAPRFTLDAGDRDQRLGIAWNAPDSAGSPVTGYLVRIDDGRTVRLREFDGSTLTSRVFENLDNGTRYRFQVAATNRADIRSVGGWSWSPWSAYEKPATVPDAPGTPNVERTDQPYGENEFRLTWANPGTNGGDGVSAWTIRVHHGGEVVQTIDAPNDDRVHVVVLANSATDYEFSVAAGNREGRGGFSAKSAPIRSYSRPGPVTNVQAKPLDSAVSVQWGAADPNGVRQDQVGYEYSVNGGSWAGFPDGVRAEGDTLRATVPANNGDDTVVSVRAVTSVDGEGSRTGEPGRAEAVKPYGEPYAPQLFRSADTAHAANMGVEVTTANNGRNIRKILLEIEAADGERYEHIWERGESGESAPSTSMRIDELLPPASSIRVTATIWDTEGQKASAQAEYWVPKPELTLSHPEGEPTTDSETPFTLSWTRLAPPPEGRGGYNWSCQYWDTEDRRWREAADGWVNYWEAGGSSGSVEVDCRRSFGPFADELAAANYRVQISSDYPQIPHGAQFTNAVAVTQAPTDGTN